jgi:Zn-dependent peptidase ImmA (M78 family)/DNA-binding XRE family transcriptional regulator
MAEQFNTTIGRKLKYAREQLGLKLEETSEKMGFPNYQTLSSIENGSRNIKAKELAQLAKIYFKSVPFFLNVEDESCTKDLVFWRECSNSPLVKEKEQEFLKYCYGYCELEKKLDLDYSCKLNPLSLAGDDFDFNKIEEIAEQYYHLMQLGSRPACSLRKILEEKYNFKIFYYDLEECGSAASSVGDFGAAILINSTEPLWRRNFDLAHELFHVLTWNILKHEEVHTKDGGKSIIEKWADAFAASLLIPASEVVKEFKSRLDNEGKILLIDLIGIAKEFEVSTQALMWRLVTLELLNRSTVQEVLKSEKFGEVDKVERIKDNKPAPNFSEKYVSLAYKAHAKDLISKGRLAEYFSINISDVNLKLAEYGYSLEEISDEKLTAA